MGKREKMGKSRKNWVKLLIIDSSGNVGIENTDTSYRLTVSGATSLKSITLNKNHVDTTGNSLNFYYNSPGTSFVYNGFNSYFSLNSNVITNYGLIVEPFIKVYNRMWKIALILL